MHLPRTSYCWLSGYTCPTLNLRSLFLGSKTRTFTRGAEGVDANWMACESRKKRAGGEMTGVFYMWWHFCYVARSARHCQPCGRRSSREGFTASLLPLPCGEGWRKAARPWEDREFSQLSRTCFKTQNLSLLIWTWVFLFVTTSWVLSLWDSIDQYYFLISVCQGEGRVQVRTWNICFYSTPLSTIIISC